MSVEAANYITLDCDVVGSSECERLQSMTQSNEVAIDAKSLQSSKPQTTGVIIAIIIGALTACALVVVGVVLWVRKRRQRRNAKRQNEEQVVIINDTVANEEWEASTVHTRMSMLSDKTVDNYPHEEEVLFCLEALDGVLTPTSAQQPHESHKSR
ncbi:hypothetical protein LPJ81_005326 [Coemansia sp. IMI 209127]|nr:hypothetical protein LPJ81_005326 [Coemansia sp. IMI 209127]